MFVVLFDLAVLFCGWRSCWRERLDSSTSTSRSSMESEVADCMIGLPSGDATTEGQHWQVQEEVLSIGPALFQRFDGCTLNIGPL